ncbi:MAG TPA: hypothetical protein VFI25_01705 [Planctomycetota bacterium]|jgi:hypothetical protein|nr:hypothetical protein [Planctomycetota bacterium]
MPRLEERAETVSPSAKTLPDGRVRDPDAAGDLGRGQFLEVVEEHRRAVRLVETEDGLEDALLDGGPLGKLRGRREGLGSRRRRLVRLPPLLAAPPPAREVREDPGEPGLQGPDGARRLFERGDDRLLDDVVRIGGLGEEIASQPADPCDVREEFFGRDGGGRFHGFRGEDPAAPPGVTGRRVAVRPGGGRGRPLRV